MNVEHALSYLFSYMITTEEETWGSRIAALHEDIENTMGRICKQKKTSRLYKRMAEQGLGGMGR